MYTNRFEYVKYLLSLGSSCSTAIEHMLHDREVMGSNPVGCWVFSSLPYQWCILNQVPHGGATLLIFFKKI